MNFPKKNLKNGINYFHFGPQRHTFRKYVLIYMQVANWVLKNVGIFKLNNLPRVMIVNMVKEATLSNLDYAKPLEVLGYKDT